MAMAKSSADNASSAGDGEDRSDIHTTCTSLSSQPPLRHEPFQLARQPHSPAIVLSQCATSCHLPLARFPSGVSIDLIGTGIVGRLSRYAELAKLRAQLAQSREANRRLDRDNRSLRASLRVPRFEELEQEEQDVLLEHFLQVRFGQYDDEGEAGWEVLRMLTQEPTWTPAVYDRSWAPSTVSEIRALAAETEGSRLATTLKNMCAMHRDYFLSAVLVPQPPPPPLDLEHFYEDDEYEYEPEQILEAADGGMFEYLPDSDAEYVKDSPEYTQEISDPPEYLLDSDEDIGGENKQEGPAVMPAIDTEAYSEPSALITAGGQEAGPGVVARWQAVTAHVHGERARKAEHFRSVVEAEMERVKAQREEEFGPAGVDAPSQSVSRSMTLNQGHRNPEGAALAAAEIGASRASWAPDYSTSNDTSTSNESTGEAGSQRAQRLRKEVDMQAEVIFPYAPTKESVAQLVRTIFCFLSQCFCHRPPASSSVWPETVAAKL